MGGGTLAALILLFLPLSADAYTIVLRDGRRVEIPDQFIIGTSTLTYEAGPAIQITLQLSTVDVAATEKINHESPGSLMRRLQKVSARAIEQKATSGRTITNEDLESFRSKRLASEATYERKRKELGLPSAEELRRESLGISERTHQQLLNVQTEDRQAETYWRTRATELRAELAAVNARINFLQARLNELPLNYSFGGFVDSPTFITVDQLSRGAVFPTAIINRNLFGPRLGGSTNFGNRHLRGGISFNSFPRRSFNRGISPFGSVVALPFDVYDTSYERSMIVNELNQLLSQRAALQSRWRSLEDEARQNGAYPGWLR